MTVTRNVTIWKETEKAYLIKFESARKTVWIPKSLIRGLTENFSERREIYKMEIDKWLLEQVMKKSPLKVV